jgi:hypothetical protein
METQWKEVKEEDEDERGLRQSPDDEAWHHLIHRLPSSFSTYNIDLLLEPTHLLVKRFIIICSCSSLLYSEISYPCTLLLIIRRSSRIR